MLVQGVPAPPRQVVRRVASGVAGLIVLGGLVLCCVGAILGVFVILLALWLPPFFG